MGYDTAGNIISRTAVQCGLGTVADAFASTDGNVVQLREYLTQLGRRLWKKHEWGILTKTHTFSTSAGVYQYTPPTDFGRLIDQTEWNRTDRRPLSPIDGQEWQYLKGLNAGVLTTILFRLVAGQIQLWPDSSTPGALSLAFEYISSYWVKPTGQSSPTTDAPTANADTLYFPDEVLVQGLKAEFLGNKSMPNALKAEQDYEEALLDAIAADVPGSILNMGTDPRGEPMISINNVPDSGYGNAGSIE